MVCFLFFLTISLFRFQFAAPLSCGSPDSQQNTTIVGKNYTIDSKIQYQCPKGHSLIGDAERTCRTDGTWSGKAPTCKCRYTYQKKSNLQHAVRLARESLFG